MNNIFFTTYQTIIKAFKDKCVTITNKEILCIIIQRLFFICIIFFFLGMSTLFIIRFLCFILFIIFFVPYLYIKHEKFLIYTIEKSKVQDILYEIVYKTIIPLSVGITIILVIYIETNYFLLDILLLENMINMLPWGIGSSMQPGTPGSSMGGSGQGSPQGPQGQPPKNPQFSIVPERRKYSGIMTYDAPTQEEIKKGCNGSLRPIEDSIMYEQIEEIKKKNPNFIIPKGAQLLVDPSLDRKNWNNMGFWRNDLGKFFKYTQHSYHNKPLRVYCSPSVIANSCVHDPCPIPEGFYSKNSDGKYVVLDCDFLRKDQKFYIKTTEGKFVEFPLPIAKDVKTILNNEKV